MTVKSQQTRAHSAQHAATLRRWLSTRETVIAMKRLAKVTRTVCGRDWHWWRSHTGKPKPFLRPDGGGGDCSSQRARVSARPRRGDQLCAGRWLHEGRRVPAGPESSSRTLGWRGGDGARALLGPGAGFDLASGLPSHPSQQVLASLPTAKCVRGQRFESRLCFSLAARCPSSRVASLDPGFLICKIRGLNEPVSHAFRCGIHT